MVAYIIIPAVALQLGWLATPVPREDMRRFGPDANMFWSACQFNSAYARHLRKYKEACEQAGMFTAVAEVQWMMNKVEERYNVWSAGAVAWPRDEPEPYSPLSWPERKFTMFRMWMGREAYYACRLPPIVPYEFFKEVPYGPVPVPPVGTVVSELDDCTPR